MEETLQMDTVTELDLALQQLDELEHKMAELRKDINYLKMEKLKENINSVGLKIKNTAISIKGKVTKAKGCVTTISADVKNKVTNLAEEIKLDIKQEISKGMYKTQVIKSEVKENITEAIDNIKETKEKVVNFKNNVVENITSKVAKTAIVPRLYASKFRVFLAQKKVDMTNSILNIKNNLENNLETQKRIEQKKNDFKAAIKEQKIHEKETNKEMNELLGLFNDYEKEKVKQEKLQLRTKRVQKIKSSIAKTAIVPRSIYSKIMLKFSELKLEATNKIIDMKDTIETKMEEYKVAQEGKREERKKIKDARKDKKLQGKILRQQQKVIRYQQMEKEIMMNKEERARIEEEFQALMSGANENVGKGR